MGAQQARLFCAIVQLMRRTTLAFLLLLAAGTATAQQQPAPAKTNEQQARSYIVSAFMTGAAPLIISDDVVVQPELRQRLGLPADAASHTVYQALANLTVGKPLQVRPAIRDEILKSQALAAPDKPIFTLEAGDTTLVMQYDLDRDNISFVGQPITIATAAPVAPPAPPEKVVDAPKVADAPAPAAADPSPASPPATPPAPPAAEPPPPPAPAAAAPAAPAAPAETAKPALQIVEPQVPRVVKPATPSAKPQTAAAMEARPPVPKPSGPCVIKPVMSDQDLVNCGATPRY
jgi:hypothetical protein